MINNIDKMTAAFEHHPQALIAAILFLVVAGIFRWLAKDIKVEHIFQHTLNNRMHFIRNVLQDGLVDDQQQKALKQRYATLVNQKIYGVKNSLIQREVINIIANSDDITDFNYFAVHQYTLSVSHEGRLYFNRDKIKTRIYEGIAILICGLVALVLGFLMMYASLILGLALCLPGVILYFGGLSHFPANPGMRKRAEKEIEKYYQQRQAQDRGEREKKEACITQASTVG